MLYNAGNLIGVPWELLIKLYRDQAGDQRFATLAEWVDDFLRFLDQGNACFPTDSQRQYFFELCSQTYLDLRALALERIHQHTQQHGHIGEAAVKRLVSRTVADAYEKLSALDDLPHLPSKHVTAILQAYGDMASKARGDIFERLPLTSAASNKLRRIPPLLLTKEVTKEDHSGVVIAGYGRDNIYPAVHEIVVDGIAVDRLKYMRRDDLAITAENTAIVKPFAQREMVSTFMEGINPHYEDVLSVALGQTFEDYTDQVVLALGLVGDEAQTLKDRLSAANNELLPALSDHMRRFRHEEYVEPVVETVSVLSKEELADMAESLVSLTSFRRRVTEPLETVGGPIDVAVISKGDGLIWMRRKHYFDPSLNPHFFANYYRA